MSKLVEVGDGLYGDTAALRARLAACRPRDGAASDAALDPCAAERIEALLRGHLRRGERCLRRHAALWDAGRGDPLSGLEEADGLAVLVCLWASEDGGCGLSFRRRESRDDSLHVSMRPDRVVAFRPAVWRVAMAAPHGTGSARMWTELFLLGSSEGS